MDSRCPTLRTLVGLALMISACSGDDTMNTTEGTTDATTSSTTSTTTTATSTSAATETTGSTTTTTTTTTTSTTDTDPTTTTTTTTGVDPVCGDGVVDPGEACDDGNADNTDECVDGCAAAACGDGFVQDGVEACDDGNADDTDTCVAGCVVATCGDGFVGPGEACDDGNTNDDDACTNACALASCGDGVIQAPEECDDADADDTDECLSTCLVAKCGDGFVQDGVEACDDANADDTDACLSSCVEAVCGDGVVYEGIEACDDANVDNTDDCTATCAAAACGDGFLHAGVEECDDGNVDDGDGCQADCTSTPGAVQVALGWYHTCALTQAGTVHCWGRSNFGQLGYGNTTIIGDDELPQVAGAVDVGAKVKAVTAGELHTCVLTDAGAVRCWGRSNVGQLGYGNTTTIGDNEKPSAVGEVDIGAKVLQIAAGRDHTCALVEGGKVRCWGSSANGQLGYGNINNIGDNELPSSAGDVDVGGTVTQITAGEFFTCALQDDLKVRCWGIGANGTLGYGNTNTIGDDEAPSTAGTLSLGTNVTAIAAGRRHSCAIAANQTLRCWGLNGQGQLGYANTQAIGDNELPATAGFVNLGGGAKAIGLALGFNHSCALLDTNKVRCWGNSMYGQLGQGNLDQIGDNEPPSAIGPVDLGDPILQIGANWYQTCARTSANAVRCWGRNDYGMLGYGNLNVIGDDELPVTAGTVSFL